MKIPREERGQATIFMAVFMALLLLGFLALALDVGYMFHQKRMAQAAADAAAVAAAEEYTNTNGNAIDSANVVNAAKVAAAKNGFDTTLATNPATVTLTPLAAGNYSNSGGAAAPTNWVQAVVSQPIHSFFLGAFIHSMRSLTVSASAIAGGGAASPTCICLEGGSGNDLNVNNNAQLTAKGCAITVDSNSPNAISVADSAGICSTSLSETGPTGIASNLSNNNSSGNSTCPKGCSPCTKDVQNGPTCKVTLTPTSKPTTLPCVTNPIATYTGTLAANAYCSNDYNNCYSLPMSGAQYKSNGKTSSIPNDTVIGSSVCYNGLDMSSSSQVHFAPGTYYINGDFTTGGGTKLYGTGVTFIITGNINMGNGSTETLSAPLDSNGDPGVLFYDSGTSITIDGGNSSSFSGIVYAPNADVVANNGTGTTLDMDFVAKTLNMAGGATITTFATPALGSGTGGGTPKLSQ